VTQFPSIFLFLAAVAASLAAAASPWHRAVAEDANTPAPREGDWNYMVGGGAMALPDYEGSKHEMVIPLPMIGASWRDTVALSTLDGLKMVVRPLEGVFISGDINYWGGRREGIDKHHGDALRGLGNISSGAVGTVEMGYQYDAFHIGIAAARDIHDGRDGTTVTLKSGYTIYQSRSFRLNAEISSSWANDKYMQAIFGITHEQSIDSLKHYAPYMAEAGVKDARIGLTSGYDISGSASLLATASVARLLDDAADSPLVRTQGSKEQISGGVSLVYRF